jgi:hypothetical protein
MTFWTLFCDSNKKQYFGNETSFCLQEEIADEGPDAAGL